MPPTRPAGFRNDVPMSTDTPVIYWPLVANAREPNVSVIDSIKPPWTVFIENLGVGWNGLYNQMHLYTVYLNDATLARIASRNDLLRTIVRLDFQGHVKFSRSGPMDDQLFGQHP